jgi:hypothetical protein
MKKHIAIAAVVLLTGCATGVQSAPTAVSPDGSIRITLTQSPCPIAPTDENAKEAKITIAGKDIGVPACWVDGEILGEPAGYLIIIADGRMGMVPKDDFR